MKIHTSNHKTPNYRLNRWGEWVAVPLRQTRKDLAPSERTSRPMEPRHVQRRRSPLLFAAMLGMAMAVDFRRAGF